MSDPQRGDPPGDAEPQHPVGWDSVVTEHGEGVAVDGGQGRDQVVALQVDQDGQEGRGQVQRQGETDPLHHQLAWQDAQVETNQRGTQLEKQT